MKRVARFIGMFACAVMTTVLLSCTPMVEEVPHEHAFGDWTESQAPTCTADGERGRVCDCGERQTERISALGHAEESHEGKAPTCLANGWQEYVT